MELQSARSRLLYRDTVRRKNVALLMLPLVGEMARFARWLVRSDRDADELVQEAAARALSAKSEPAEEKIKAWLFRIVRNVFIDQRRAQAARDRLIVLEGGLDELAEVELRPLVGPLRWDAHDLEAAIAELPEGARSALLLSDLWGFDCEEIGEILSIPVGTAKSRVARARARVALLLSRSDADSRAQGGRP
jgi:RNA polymerase sigma-70 factor (ECF subfamily)